MDRKTIALLLILFVASNSLSFLFGAQYNSNPLVLNITNGTNDTGFDTGFNDYTDKSNITKKKNSTSNSTIKKNKTISNGNSTNSTNN